MVDITTAPNPPAFPQIDLATNFNLPGLVSESVSDVIWNTISITTPTVPTFSFPDTPNNVDPVEPVKPTLKTLDIPTPEYFKVLEDPPVGPAATDINVPNRVTLTLWTNQVPQFSTQPPVENIVWSYESFTTEFRSVLATLFQNFERSENTKSYFEFINSSILENEVDFLEERGNDNPVKDKITRMLKLSQGDFASFQEILDHELDFKYKGVEIATRQDNERILRDQYKTKKELEFQFADKVVSNWIQNYNACIQLYNTQVNYYASLAEDYQNKIQANGLRLEKMSKELGIGNDIKNYNVQLVSLFQAEAESNVSLISLFQAQMNVAKRLLQLELISLELFQVEVEAFTASVRALEGKARETEVLALADADIAETSIAPALLDELNAKVQIAESELEVEKVKFSAARDIYEAKENAINAQIRTFQGGVSSQENLLQAETELSYERSRLDKSNRVFAARSEEDQRLVNFKDKASLNQIHKEREGTGDGFTGFLGTLESRRDDDLFTDRLFNLKVNDAELDSVRKFSEAKIVNSLLHVIGNS